MTPEQRQQLKQITDQLEAMELNDKAYFELPGTTHGELHFDYKGNAEGLTLLATKLLLAAQKEPGKTGTAFAHGGDSYHEIEIAYAVTDETHDTEIDDGDLPWGCQLALVLGVVLLVTLVFMMGVGIYTSYQWLMNG